MVHPVFSSVFDQRRPFDTTISGVFVQPEQRPQARLRQDRMRRIEINMKLGNTVVDFSQPVTLPKRKVRKRKL